MQPTSNDALITAIESNGILVKTTLPIIDLTPLPTEPLAISNIQQPGQSSNQQQEPVTKSSDQQPEQVTQSNNAIIGGAVGGGVGGLLTLTGLAILYRRLFVPPAQEGNIVRGAGVGDPARVRADIVNGEAFGNQQQHPRLAVLDPENLNFQPNVVRGLNGRN